MESESALWLALKTLIRKPFQMGELFPSTQKTRLIISNIVKNAPNSIVIELGAGTGEITEKILAKGVKPENFIAIELETSFCKHLIKKFPNGPKILNIDASLIMNYLPNYFIGKTDYVISTLPLITIGKEKTKIIVEAIFKILKKNGVFVQVTLSPFTPKFIKENGLKAVKLCTSWMNIPPMFIWRVMKKDDLEL